MASLAAPRRPLKTRERRWAKALARWLAARGVRPNAVSLASVVFAGAAGLCLFFSLEQSGDSCGPLLVLAAAFIQLRLLCNMLDGLLAVEGGFRSPVGDLYNEMPDRIADTLILVGAGYSIRTSPWGTILGWTAALLAMFTAYVRVLGGSLGLAQSFMGPMAKQHRMFVTTLACLLAAAEVAVGWPPRIMTLGLVVLVVGSCVTALRRTLRIARELKSR